MYPLLVCCIHWLDITNTFGCHREYIVPIFNQCCLIMHPIYTGAYVHLCSWIKQAISCDIISINENNHPHLCSGQTFYNVHYICSITLKHTLLSSCYLGFISIYCPAAILVLYQSLFTAFTIYINTLLSRLIYNIHFVYLQLNPLK